MSLTDSIDELRRTFPSSSPDPEELRRLRLFYESMIREKAVLKKVYDLPQLDTVGSNLVRGHVQGTTQGA